MERLPSTSRPGWEQIVEGQGLIYHHTKDGVYWDESACYRFTAREIDELDAATNELQACCLDAAHRGAARPAGRGSDDIDLPARHRD